MIKAIETRYHGCRFRSRLEARWAVLFDSLNLKWQYEPEGYDLPSGYYLPDFYLPSIDTWIEIKGTAPTPAEFQLGSELSGMTGKPIIIFPGQIELPDEREYPFAMGGFHFVGEPNLAGYDHPYHLCECSRCGAIGIHFDGRSARLKCRKHGACKPDYYDDKSYNYNSPRLIRAYEAARSARFEHGESGAA